MSSIEHPDHRPYKQFTKAQRVEKAVQTFKGMLEGVSIDQQLNAEEVAEILNWLNEYSDLVGRAPFNEMKQKMDEILEDGIIDPEEQEDLLWLCTQLMPDSEFFDEVTHGIQRLHGIMHGIMADGVITQEEAIGLQEWVDDHDYLKGSYPYDELDSLLMQFLKDKKLDEKEAADLAAFFDDFFESSFHKRVRDEAERVKSGVSKKFTKSGICASCPDITFQGKSFVFTGASGRAVRSKLEAKVEQLGGNCGKNITNETEFLIVGSGGNPCWAFSCYGRKVERAVEMRKSGHPIIIVHESDFWDAVEDAAC